MTAWFLLMMVLVYGPDDGGWHRMYQMRDAAFSSQEECEAARWRRVHNDMVDGNLQTACVQATLRQESP